MIAIPGIKEKAEDKPEHFFENQLFGLAPSEIIHNFILLQRITRLGAE